MSMLVTINTKELQQLAQQLGLMPAAIDRALATVLKTLAPKVMDRAQSKMVSRVKLSRQYVENRMKLTPATVARPVAIIKAQERATRLATYMAKQRIVGAKRAKGDPSRGIPKRFKQSGIYTGVKPGTSKLMSHAFLIPLRAGTVAGGNGMGIFVRTGKGKKAIRQLYGPSVNQLFSGIAKEMEEPVMQEMEDNLQREVIAAMRSIAGGTP